MASSPPPTQALIVQCKSCCLYKARTLAGTQGPSGPNRVFQLSLCLLEPRGTDIAEVWVLEVFVTISLSQSRP